MRMSGFVWSHKVREWYVYTLAELVFPVFDI